MKNLIKKIVDAPKGLAVFGTLFGLSMGFLGNELLRNYSTPQNNVSVAYLNSTKQNITVVLENKGGKTRKITMVPSDYGFDIAHVKRIKSEGYQIYQPKYADTLVTKEAGK